MDVDSGTRSFQVALLAAVGALLTVCLLPPAVAQAGTTKVTTGPKTIVVEADDDPHVLQIYTSTRQAYPPDINWPLVAGLATPSLLELQTAAALEPSIWGEVIVGTLTLAIFTLQEIRSRSETEAVLEVFDRTGGAIVKPDPSSPECDHPREQGAVRPLSRTQCPIEGVSKLFVKTGAAEDVVNLRKIDCDTCFSTASKNIEVRTGDAHDEIKGSKYADLIDAGPGNDWVRAGASADVIYGFHQVSPFQNLTLTPSVRVDSDIHYGGDPAWGPDDDRLLGEGGVDVISGGPGNDLVDGGPQDDLSSFSAVNDPSIFPELDDLTFYELLGGAGEDVIIGGTGMDGMEGGPDRDTMLARESDYKHAGFYAKDERDRVDCAKPDTVPVTGPEYYRISSPSPETPDAPLDVLADTCTEELSIVPALKDLRNWPAGSRWWWYE